MPKRAQVAPPKVLTPRQLSRWQKERRRQRVIFSIGSLIILLIVGVLGFGFYDSRIAPRWQPAVRVNDVTFNTQYFVNYLRVILGNQPKDSQTVSSVAHVLAEEIQNNQLVKQAALEFNISVSNEEIDQAIKDSIVSPDDKDKVDNAEIQKRLKQLLSNLKIDEAFFREVEANTIWRKKLQEKLESQVPTKSEQVKLSDILLDDDVTAADVHAKLEKGEDFAALAKEFSKDEATKEKGGDMGWVPRGLYPDLEETAFGLPKGTPSQPIATSSGYYIFLVTEKEASKPIAEDTLKILKSRALGNWLQETREKNRLEEYITLKGTDQVNPKKLSWILQQLNS